MTEGWARVIAPGYSAYYVLFFIHLESRRICLAGVTRHPNQEWMEQMARNVTMEDTIQEDPVKRLKYLSLAFLVASLLAIPAMAQRAALTGAAQQGGSHVPIRFRPRTRGPTRIRTPPRAARRKRLAHARAGRKTPSTRLRVTASRNSPLDARSNRSGGAARVLVVPHSVTPGVPD